MKFNQIEWLNKVTDCSKKRICIEATPDAAKEYKIFAVPTLIIFNEGEEVERFSPNIMFQTDATKEEIQEAIDEEVMSDFLIKHLENTELVSIFIAKSHNARTTS